MQFGINGIVLTIAGFLGGRLSKSFSKDSRMTIMVIVMGMTFVCELVSYILQILVLKSGIEIWSFLKIIGIEIVYNTMLVIIIYPLLQSSGNLIERIFTEDKILTRYY